MANQDKNHDLRSILAVTLVGLDAMKALDGRTYVSDRHNSLPGLTWLKTAASKTYSRFSGNPYDGRGNQYQVSIDDVVAAWKNPVIVAPQMTLTVDVRVGERYVNKNDKATPTAQPGIEVIVAQDHGANDAFDVAGQRAPVVTKKLGEKAEEQKVKGRKESDHYTFLLQQLKEARTARDYDAYIMGLQQLADQNGLNLSETAYHKRQAIKNLDALYATVKLYAYLEKQNEKATGVCLHDLRDLQKELKKHMPSLLMRLKSLYQKKQQLDPSVQGDVRTAAEYAFSRAYLPS